MSEKTPSNFNRWERLQRWVGLSLAAFGLIAKDVDIRVRYWAFLIAALLIVIWLLSELREIWLRNRLRWFPLKLSKDQKARLYALVNETIDMMSPSMTYSPYYVWHSSSNTFPGKIHMNNDYHTTVHAWWMEIRSLLSNRETNATQLIPMMLHTVAATNTLASHVQHDLENLIATGALTDTEKNQVTKNWEITRMPFNLCMDRWSTLFKELHTTATTPQPGYYRPIEMIR